MHAGHQIKQEAYVLYSCVVLGLPRAWTYLKVMQPSIRGRRPARQLSSLPCLPCVGETHTPIIVRSHPILPHATTGRTSKMLAVTVNRVRGAFLVSRAASASAADLPLPRPPLTQAARRIWHSPHLERESDGGMVREDEPHLKRIGRE